VEKLENADVFMVGENHYHSDELKDNFYFISQLISKESMKKKDFILLFEGNSYVKDDYIDTCPIFFLSRILISQ
jgi:hypothetical protein